MSNQSTPEVTRADVTRELSGETVCGFRVAAYRETHPEHGAKFGHHYSEHWSTPNSRDPRVTVERLFTEDQLRKAVSATPARGGDELREAAEQLLKAMTTRSLRGRDHVPSMRDEQDAASNLRKALSSTDMAGAGEGPKGTFACPICGQDTPHHHTPAVVDAYQNKGSRA